MLFKGGGGSGNRRYIKLRAHNAATGDQNSTILQQSNDYYPDYDDKRKPGQRDGERPCGVRRRVARRAPKIARLYFQAPTYFLPVSALHNPILTSSSGPVLPHPRNLPHYAPPQTRPSHGPQRPLHLRPALTHPLHTYPPSPPRRLHPRPSHARSPRLHPIRPQVPRTRLRKLHTHRRAPPMGPPLWRLPIRVLGLPTRRRPRTHAL